jgi:hypothetical protein
VLLSKKLRKKVSSRQQIAIRGVRDNILVLPGNRYRAIIRVSSVNFELKSEAEQDALIDTYQNFLNSLSINLQIIVRVRELDMDNYLATFTERLQNERDVVYQQQIQSYVSFVGKLVTSNKILTRHFYVVIPNQGTDDFTIIREQLNTSIDIVSKGLARMGMHCVQMTSLEVLDLFYSFYNPAAAKRQQLTDQTMQLLQGVYL